MSTLPVARLYGSRSSVLASLKAAAPGAAQGFLW